jgi:hypothetical protein
MQCEIQSSAIPRQAAEDIRNVENVGEEYSYMSYAIFVVSTIPQELSPLGNGFA